MVGIYTNVNKLRSQARSGALLHLAQRI